MPKVLTSLHNRSNDVFEEGTLSTAQDCIIRVLTDYVLFLNYLQVDILTMLEEAIDYVKYLQNQVKVHIIYPAHINNHITLATMELAKLNHTVYDLKKQKFPCNSFLATT